MSATSLWIGIATAVLFIFLLKRGISVGVERRFKTKLEEIKREKEQALAVVEKRELLVAQMRAEFDKSYVGGRQWLVGLIGEATVAPDDLLAQILVRKSRPAFRAAEEVKRVKEEKREWVQ